MCQPNLQSHLNHLWDQLKHENDMLNHRLSWLWTLQGLLFASFGLLLENISAGKLPISTICAVGICSCISVGYSVQKGHQVLNSIRPSINTILRKIESDLALDETKTVKSGCFAFLHPWRFMPWVICVAWAVLLWWVQK